MNYRLVVLTHGESPTLARTLTSFLEMVTPRPAWWFLACDGAAPELNLPVGAISALGIRGNVAGNYKRHGFCEATRLAWEEAAESEQDYVFWLEHDFIFKRPVDLRELASVLDQNLRPGKLAQMTLMRNAVNEREREAGGLFESRPGEYFERVTADGMTFDLSTPDRRAQFEGGSKTNYRWLQHQSYFSTNPSLMTRKFMEANPWPTYKTNCEGRFGIELVARGYSFGVWGDGTVWVEHLGDRTGFGY